VRGSTPETASASAITRAWPSTPGRREADLLHAVVVQRRAAQHRADGVAVAQRVLEALQDDDRSAVAADLAAGAAVEGAHVPVGCEDAALDAVVALGLQRREAHAAGQRHVALAPEQRLRAEVHADQRRRAGRLHGDARPLEVELVGDPRGQEVLLVGQVDVDHAHALEHLGAREQVLGHVVRAARPGVDRDRARVARGLDAGVLERLPGELEEDALLRVGELGFARADLEEAGVEVALVGQVEAGLDVARVGEQRGVDAGLEQLLVRPEGQRLDPVAQVAPELADVGGAGEAARHADDRDRGILGHG
jgi:hypothetical protein